MTSSTRPTTSDWSAGRYETTAMQLLPAARAAVARAAIAPGERVVDVGCGTGNAALLAAERGARVIGVDPAARLLEVAREQAAARGLDATFVAGDAASLPVPAASVDVVLSVFGVIFAGDPEAAAAELARVAAPGGRLVLTAWIPGGATSEVMRISREAVAAALGSPPAPPPFPWHDRGALEALLAPHGYAVTLHQERVTFRATSPRAYLEEQSLTHPLAVAARAVLEPRGELDAVSDRLVAVYEAANEDPAAFAVTVRYVVAVAAARG